MKQPKRIGYIIGIGLISVMMAYIFWTQSTEDNRLQMMTTLVIMLSFIFFGYWRLYQFYRLEKIWKLHNHVDFVEYFDNMNLVPDGIRHFVLPLPIWKKLKTEQENKLRTIVNISTALVYLLFGLFIYLSSDF